MPRITVLKVKVTPGPAGKNYKICEVGYKTDEGKVKGMRILDFVQKDVFSVAEKLQPGDIVDAAFSQNDKGYWQFNSLTPTGEKGDKEVVTAASAPSKGNWETTDERAARQVMIVRQSSLSNAVAFFEAAKSKPAVADVITVAKSFEAYVLGKDEVTGNVE